MCPATPPLCHPLTILVFLFAPVTVIDISIFHLFSHNTHRWCSDWFHPETKALIRVFFVSLSVSFHTVLYARGIYRLGLGLSYWTCHFHLRIIFFLGQRASKRFSRGMVVLGGLDCIGSGSLGCNEPSVDRPVGGVGVSVHHLVIPGWSLWVLRESCLTPFPDKC